MLTYPKAHWSTRREHQSRIISPIAAIANFPPQKALILFHYTEATLEVWRLNNWEQEDICHQTKYKLEVTSKDCILLVHCCTLLYNVSLLIGCWEMINTKSHWSIYRDHLIGQLTSSILQTNIPPLRTQCGPKGMCVSNSISKWFHEKKHNFLIRGHP